VSKRRSFFFEKKKQKTLLLPGRAGFNATVLKEQKAAFFQKAAAFFLF
jgi:hypothetical protein